jgi:hypothetical protein
VVRVGAEDRFEQEYRANLKALLVPYGLLIDYSEDRAALDVGLHLFERPVSSPAKVSQVRVWFQAKGIQRASLSADKFAEQDLLPVRRLSVEHVRFWYGSPEPVYLAVYIDATDQFLAEDIRDVVDREGGAAKLAELAAAGQKEMTLRVRTEALLLHTLESMPRHRSMRVDGPLFRGRPLGHRYDPLRSEMKKLTPEDFDALVLSILKAHELRLPEEVALREMLDLEVGRLAAFTGTLYLSYEWVSPLFTEFGYDPGSDFRIESPPNHAQGDVMVVIHSEPLDVPRPTEASKELVKEIRSRGINQGLVFFNDSELDGSLFGGWKSTLEPLVQVPQGLGSLSFNVLTANAIYLEFVARLEWRHINFL